MPYKFLGLSKFISSETNDLFILRLLNSPLIIGYNERDNFGETFICVQKLGQI